MAVISVQNKTRVDVDMKSLEKYAARLLESTRDWRDAELSIMLAGDKRIQTLNERWRGKETPTDVLSFPMEEEPLPGGPLLMGDIVIGVRQAMGDAKEEGVSLEDKMKELVLHSVLHLMGYDHENPEDARKMEKRRRGILKKIGDM